MRVMPLVFTGFLLTASPAVMGQQPQPFLPRDAATDARLDPLFAARDWKSLEALLTRPADLEVMAKNLNWMKRHAYEDGNFFVAIMYTSNLWALSQASSEYADLGQTAALFALYAIALVRVDGAVCEDKSGPQRRLDQIMSWFDPVLKASRTLPDNRKMVFAVSATTLERVTSRKRTEKDESLCAGGLSELSAGLSSGTAVTIGPQPGQAGNTVVVTPPPGWKPAFVPEESYKAEQAAIRKDLTQSLYGLIK
jgi:hypothetical protein